MTTPFLPLTGVLVIDLSRALAGPHAAMLLGDLGARVIKIEAPGTGDDTRTWGPPFMQPDPDDPDYATNIRRLEHIDALTEQLERCLANLDRDTMLAQLTEAGVPAGRIRGIDEVYEWDQTRSQRLTLNVEHASLGPLTLPGMALRTFEMSSAGELSESTRREHDAPPLLDADGTAIRSWLR